jgi:hypothetical protein
MNQQLISFYRDEGADAAGRSIAQILTWDHGKLEAVHDYIQWLFPSATASKFNDAAPLLDDETVAAMKADATIQANLSLSLDLMLGFYGLELSDSAPLTVTKAGNYADRKANWQDAPPGYINHNLLRLSRILEALRVLGLSDESAALFHCLESIQAEEPAKIPAKTLAFWRKAAAL